MQRVTGYAAVAAALAVVVVTFGAGAAPPAREPAGTGLAPHRAIYSMALATSHSGSGLAGARGTMSYEFADSCDGWTVENRISITYSYTEGPDAVTTTDFLTWESKDGLHYRFRLRNTRDGQITEEVEGTAELKGKGLGGVAKFTRPEPKTVQLPKGTLFPTEHTVHLMAAARSGSRTFPKVVFDGSDAQGAYDVNAVIGRARTDPAGLVNPLVESPSWPMRLAFFPMTGAESAPEFEMGVDYHPNGVAQSIVQLFRNFSLRGRLQSIEPLPRRAC